MRKYIIMLGAAMALSLQGFGQDHNFTYSTAAGLWGYVSSNGTEITPSVYRSVSPYSKDGYATAVNSQTKAGVLLNAKGEAMELGVKGITRTEYIGETEKNVERKLVIVESGKKQGIVSVSGKVIHEQVYDKIYNSPDGTIYAKTGTQFFILSKDGTSIKLASEILEVKDFTEGLAPFRNASKLFGFIDSKGAIVIPAQFTSVGYFSIGLAWAKTVDRKVGFIDKTGKWIIDAKFDMVKEFDASSKRALASIGEAYYFLTPTGEEISVEGATKLGQFEEGYAYAFKGKLVGFVDPSGKWIVDAKYTKVHGFHEGLARVQLNAKWGYINAKGEEVIPANFEDAEDFKNGFATVKQGTQWGLINSKGEFVIQPKYLKMQ